MVTPEAEIGWYKVWGIEPWDHTYCAIALDLVGEHERARSAYEWLLSTQNDDGSWCAYYDRFGEAEEEAPLGLVSIPFRGSGSFQSNALQKLHLYSSVNFSAMTYCGYSHYFGFIVNLIYHSIISYPQTIRNSRFR